MTETAVGNMVRRVLSIIREVENEDKDMVFPKLMLRVPVSGRARHVGSTKLMTFLQMTPLETVSPVAPTMVNPLVSAIESGSVASTEKPMCVCACATSATMTGPDDDDVCMCVCS